MLLLSFADFFSKNYFFSRKIISEHYQSVQTVCKGYLSADRKRNDSVVKCLTRDQGASGSSLTDVTALCLPASLHSVLEQDTLILA